MSDPWATPEYREWESGVMAFQARQIDAGLLRLPEPRMGATCPFCSGNHSCWVCPSATDKEKRARCS
jgi:hypothetical protein